MKHSTSDSVSRARDMDLFYSTPPLHEGEGSAFHKPRVSQDLVFCLGLISDPVFGTVSKEEATASSVGLAMVIPGEKWGL